MTEEEWAGALHWKTWVLAGLDICISTIKCAHSCWTGPELGLGALPGLSASEAFKASLALAVRHHHTVSNAAAHEGTPFASHSQPAVAVPS